MGKYAVCVGINDYGGDDLPSCVNDVEAWKHFLMDHYGFSEENIRVCLDKQATAHMVTDLLRWLFQNRTAKDPLLFTFSGHGSWTLPPGGKGWECCICCADCGSDWDHGVITNTEFNRELAAIHPAAFSNVVLDSCFSGGMTSRHRPLPELPADVQQILYGTTAEDRRKRGLRALPGPSKLLDRARKLGLPAPQILLRQD